jgi:hypothetical protein
MLSAIQRGRAKVNLAARFLTGLILCYSAVIFCLPVPSSEETAALYPWFGKRITIGNVQLHELLFIGWLILYGKRFILRTLFQGPERRVAVCLIVLALWCGLISLMSPLPWLDFGRTLRLLLNAVLLLAVVRWTRQSGNFPLGMLILGFFSGTIINLVLSFQYPAIVNGTMRLSGQNTPGVAMGVAIHLTAWLFFRTSHRKLQAFALFTTFAFTFGCAISFSRIGWFAGGLGLIAWLYVLVLARPRERSAWRRLRIVRLVVVPLLVIVLGALLVSPLGQQWLQWIQSLAQQKIVNQGESNTQRWAYAIGTAEILARYPLGVGYTGFYNAMTATDIYASGSASEEDSPSEANPHAAFLWYTTAGGIPGGLVALLVFFMLLNSMRFGMISAMGQPGFVLFALVALPFLVIGLTVTYLFNSIILIVPVAIAAGWGWTRRLERRDSQHFTINHNHAKKNL